MRPIQPQEAAGAGHLVPAVQGEGVVDKTSREGIVPGGRGIVLEGARVTGDVDAAPPQVHMQLVGVRGAVLEVGGVDEGAALAAIKAQHIRGLRLLAGVGSFSLQVEPAGHFTQVRVLVDVLVEKGFGGCVHHRAEVSEILNSQGEEVGPIIGPQVGDTAGVGVCERPQPARGCSQVGAGGQRPVRRACAAAAVIGKEGRLQHQPMVIGAVLGIGAEFIDLLLEAPVQPAQSQLPPAGGLGVILQVGPCRVEPGRLRQQVVVVLGAGINQGGRDPPGMFCNGLP